MKKEWDREWSVLLSLQIYYRRGSGRLQSLKAGNDNLKEARPEVRRGLLVCYSTVEVLKREGGHRITDRTDVGENYRKFYTNQFTLCLNVLTPRIYETKQQAFVVLIGEVWNAVFQMKNGEAVGNNDINFEFVKAGRHELWEAVVFRFCRFLFKNTILEKVKKRSAMLKRTITKV